MKYSENIQQKKHNKTKPIYVNPYNIMPYGIKLALGTTIL